METEMNNINLHVSTRINLVTMDGLAHTATQPKAAQHEKSEVICLATVQ
jgi:hypothetical protein